MISSWLRFSISTTGTNFILYLCSSTGGLYLFIKSSKFLLEWSFCNLGISACIYFSHGHTISGFHLGFWKCWQNYVLASPKAYPQTENPGSTPTFTMQFFKIQPQAVEMLRLWVKFTKEKQGGHITNKMKFPVFSPCYINFPCLLLHKNYQLVLLIKSSSTL